MEKVVGVIKLYARRGVGIRTAPVADEAPRRKCTDVGQSSRKNAKGVSADQELRERRLSAGHMSTDGLAWPAKRDRHRMPSRLRDGFLTSCLRSLSPEHQA